MTWIQELNLSRNQLSTLPEAIGQLSQLQQLGLYSNQLSTLPEAIGQLSQLQKLDLSNNQLSTLPDAVQSLEKLGTVFLHGNPGLGLPDEVLGRQMMRFLVLKKDPQNPRAKSSTTTLQRAGRRDGVMGGGAGTRLFPLTKDRAKPAVPLAGKYRLVDIPISNCLNSGLRRVYVLTQFNSTSLNRHINASYKFDNFSTNFVEILAAQQTPEAARWYQGTADAVRQNLRYFLEGPYQFYLILSGDQLYRMDYRLLLQQHVETGADITLATTPVDRAAASSFGIMHSDSNRRIFRFEEKPKVPALLGELRIPPTLVKELGLREGSELFQGSMGIYVFNRNVLIDCLKNDEDDFGKNIIPSALQSHKVIAYIFQGYWEDIGTVRAFFEANLALTETVPPYNFFDRLSPIYTRPRFLPASKVNAATFRGAVVGDGCIISDAHIERAVIGIRSIIESGATIRNSVIMGADFYEDEANEPSADGGTRPPIGIGRNSVIDRAIIDKNARIGESVVITPDGKAPNVDSSNYYIRDGVVVIPKNAVIPNGTWI